MSKIIGKYKIELKNVKAIDGHDDTFPYVAELWVNRKHIANCHNDGWGGDTLITPIDMPMFKDVSEIVCATKFAFKEKYWNYTMPMFVDELAIDAIRMQTIKKHQVNNRVFMDDSYSLFCVPFKTKTRKTVPIAEMLLSQRGQDMIKKSIDKHTKEGLKLMNTNIRYTKVLN